MQRTFEGDQIDFQVPSVDDTVFSPFMIVDEIQVSLGEHNSLWWDKLSLTVPASSIVHEMKDQNLTSAGKIELHHRDECTRDDSLSQFGILLHLAFL